jgi:dipeptidyl aminopeptidase/acylaminoacyl peptidase
MCALDCLRSFRSKGDADPTVPYSQNVRLHQALDNAGVGNMFVTVPGGKHGGFSDAEMAKVYAEIRGFLGQNIARLSAN